MYSQQECAAGADGPKGYQGSRGVKGDTGPPEIVSTNWRHCTWYHKNDGNDNAQVAVSNLIIFFDWISNIKHDITLDILFV